MKIYFNLFDLSPNPSLDHIDSKSTFLFSGMTMATTSDEMVEACHQGVRNREVRFGTVRTRFLSGPQKQRKMLEAITKFNSLNRG